MATRKFNINIRDYGIVFVLLIEVLLFAVMRQQFFTMSNMITVIRQAAIVCICGVGMLFVLITGGIDLSVGWMMSATGMLAAYLMTTTSLNPLVICLLVFIVMIIIGGMIGTIISVLHIAPFIVTMAFMNVLKGFAFLITNGKNVYGLPESFNYIGQGYIGPIPVPIILMAFALFLGWFVLNKAYVGRHFYAVGSNEEASMLSGINVTATKISTYMISSFFATFAGLVMLARIKTASPTTGNGYEFDVITACVVGGVSMTGGAGRVYHVLVGSLIIAVLNNGMIIMQVSEYVQIIFKGIILLAAVIYDEVQKSRAMKVKA
ncbi:MAG: ABC transporter permease [Planctomycetes bacterium]|nr:ABC transporter permease [Planctomycetota bacterium]